MSQPRELAFHQHDFSRCEFCGRVMSLTTSGQMACDCRAWQKAYARRTGYPSWAYEAAVEIQRANKYFSHPAAERMARIIAEKAR